MAPGLSLALMPRVLDLYCCQGGASTGYAAAGFEVCGVDIVPQPRYPFKFRQMGALEFLHKYRHGIRRHFSAVHASPPCQGYSGTQPLWGKDWPDLVGPTRDALLELELPFIIENVEGAPLLDPVTLCGTMFWMPYTYRHRLFETGNGFTIPQPRHPAHTAPMTKMGRPATPGEKLHAVGNFNGVKVIRDEWQVPHMDRDGVREAIPPAYTYRIGLWLQRYLAN